MFCKLVCFVSNNVVADECDHVVLDKAALCMDSFYPMYTTKVCTTNYCCKEIKFKVSLDDVCYITVTLTILSTMCEGDSVVSPAEYL